MNPNDLKTTEQLIEEVDTLFEGSNTNGPTLKVEDKFEVIRPFLYEKALKAFEKKAMYLTVKEGDSSYKCLYLAKRVPSTEVDNAVRSMATTINELAEEDLIHSVLAPPGEIKLIQRYGEVEASVVFCYVLVPEQKYAELNLRYQNMVAQESEEPKSEGDFRLPLKDGEFLAEVRISSWLSGHTGKVDEEINLYLAVLPKGTEFVSKRELPIVALSRDYEVKFFNPVFKRIKHVSLDYVRHVEAIDDSLKHYNLLTDIRYFDADRKELFKG